MNSNKFDNDVKDALQRNGGGDSRGDVNVGSDPGLFALIADSFRGRMRWLTAITWGMTLVMFVLSVLAAVWFFQAETTRSMIMFATVFLYCSIAVGLLKIWGWMEIERHAVTREIKRLELRIAQLQETR